MKIIFLIFTLFFSTMSFGQYKIFFSSGAGMMDIPEVVEGIEEEPDVSGGFVAEGYDYSASDFTILNDTSFEIGSIYDGTSTAPNGGVFWDKELVGDFEVSFETDAWGALNSGFLGLMIERENITTRLIEVASYTAYNGGCPFVRWFNSYGYNGKDCNLSATYKFKLIKSNGKFLSVVENLRTGQSFSQQINADNHPVRVGVYFVYTNIAYYDKKLVKNFTITEY